MLFTLAQLSLITAAIVLLVGSLASFTWKKKIVLSLLLLFAGALLLRFFYASLDPFLNMWDEQFHALVAKNMLQHPLVPTLYEYPVLNYSPGNWVEEHVWLHKQPLFLWQITLSYKLFGMSELTTRLPSIILSSCVVFFIYRIGRISINERAGFIGAWVYAVAYYSMELIVNRFPTDHNDIAFHFYVTASIWSWTEYKLSGKWRWIILTGLFSGLGVLVKWLTALLVFSGWGISVLAMKATRNKLSNYLHIAAAFAVAVLVFLPWQLYIINEFPVESEVNYKLTAMHFTEVVEDHGGDALFYFHNLRTLYGGGQLVPFLIILAVIFFLYKVKDLALRTAFATFITVVYLFFTLAATKMVSFCYIVSPFVFLALGTVVDSLVTWLHGRLKRTLLAGIAGVIIVIFLGIMCFDLSKFEERHLAWRKGKDPFYPGYYKDMQIIKDLSKDLPPRAVLLNCKGFQNIAAMFYNDCTAYARLATQEEAESIKKKGFSIVGFDDGKLPAYLANDPSVKKLDKGYHRKASVPAR